MHAVDDVIRARLHSDVVLVKQFGIESKLDWVNFCEQVPGERTGESAQAQDFLAGMQNNQSRD